MYTLLPYPGDPQPQEPNPYGLKCMKCILKSKLYILLRYYYCSIVPPVERVAHEPLGGRDDLAVRGGQRPGLRQHRARTQHLHISVIMIKFNNEEAKIHRCRCRIRTSKIQIFLSVHSLNCRVYLPNHLDIYTFIVKYIMLSTMTMLRQVPTIKPNTKSC